MENLGLGDQFFIDLLGPQIHIRAGIAVEGKVTVAIGIGVDKGQSRMDLIVQQQIAGVDAHGFHHFFQVSAEEIVTDLANVGGLLSQLCEHGQNIADRAAGICLQQVVTLIAEAVFRKIDQEFSQCGYIKLLHGITP